MKTRRIIISMLAAIAAVAFASCQKAEDVKENPAVEVNGTVGKVTFRVSSAMDETTIATKASSEAETNVEDLAIILIPKSGGTSKVITTGLELGDPNKVSDTNYIYPLTIDFSESGASVEPGDYYMYAVANAADKFVTVNLSDLEGKSKDYIDSYIVTKANAELDFAETALLMTGKYTPAHGTASDGSVTLTDGDTTLDGVICLRRIMSKSVISFVNGSSTATGSAHFTPKSYSIYNYSRSSSLMERDCWEGSNPAAGADFYGSSTAFSKNENVEITDGKIEFYMPENLQTSYPSTPDKWTYKMREVRNDYSEWTEGSYDLTKHGTFTYAPSKATYIVVTGDYYDDTYSGTVSYTIHLGNFGSTTDQAAEKGSTDNFSVRRNYKYTYKITVNGVSNIIAEAKAEDSNRDFFQPGAEGTLVKAYGNTDVTLDAHYEQVMISFDNLGDSFNYNILVNTPFTDGNLIDDDGVNMTNVKPNCQWVWFGKPASKSAFAAYNKANVTDIYGLAADLAAKTGNYYIQDGGKTYIAAYVDEYYYEDKDLSSFINADDRQLQMSLTDIYVSPDSYSTLTDGILFSIKQRSIKCVEKLSLDNPFGYERVEETTPDCGDTDESARNNVTAKISSGTERLNGWTNFNDWISGNWSKYVDIANNGHFTNSDAGAAMTSRYDYGWYQCMSRNRDEDGDGVIDEDEIKWYLPAVDQYLTLMVGNPSFASDFVTGVDNPLYLTSTAGVANDCTWFAAEGLAYGKFGQNWWKNWNLHVRCVRSLKDPDGDVSAIYTYTTSSNTISITGLNDYAIRESYMEGEYGTHNLGDPTPNKLPQSFVVAKSDLSVDGTTRFGTKDNDYVEITKGSLCSSNYYEEEDASDLGKWRIPNAKEFYLYSLCFSITDPSTSRTISSYWNQTGSYTTNGTIPVYYFDKVISTSPTSSPWTHSTGAAIRCVRDVESSSTALTGTGSDPTEGATFTDGGDTDPSN